MVRTSHWVPVRVILRARLAAAICILTAAALAGCSSGGGAGNAGAASGPSSSGAATQACANCGTAMVTLTDVPGDFASYIVNVVSLSLTRSDGTVVQTVPVTTQVDFAQLVDLSEIVSADQVPAGRYVSASLTLDYSNATIVVENSSGTDVTIAPGDIVDGANNEPLTGSNSQLTLTLSLSDSNQLIVTPNAVANLALDFNLLASNTITPSTGSPTGVTVNPVLTASLVPAADQQIRLRGPLVSVNAASGSYVVDVRPFQNLSNTSGQVTVDTTTTTTYTINGSSYSGSAGLTQLASEAAGTLTVAYGSWNSSTQAFTASEVLAGSSVTGTAQAGVQGTVLSRTGDTLTLADGLITQPNHGGMLFVPQVTATIGSGTTVTEMGQTGTSTATIVDISVGQQLQLSGTLTITNGSGGSPPTATLDATSGSAELLPTSLLGIVTANSSGLITVNLQTLGGRPASAFTFTGTGTGTGSSQDATAAAYSVAVPSSLSTSALSVGLPAGFSGFVAPFGDAPPDFTASTLTSYAQTRALLEVRWASPGVTSPFATLTGSGLLISQANLQASAQHVIRIAGLVLDPSTLSSGLQLVPDTSTDTFQAFAIVHLKSWTVNNYGSFNDLATALSTDLNGTTAALQVSAIGTYDPGSGVLTADQLAVMLDN